MELFICGMTILDESAILFYLYQRTFELQFFHLLSNCIPDELRSILVVHFLDERVHFLEEVPVHLEGDEFGDHSDSVYTLHI
jgi:hypothetical protein